MYICIYLLEPNWKLNVHKFKSEKKQNKFILEEVTAEAEQLWQYQSKARAKQTNVRGVSDAPNSVGGGSQRKHVANLNLKLHFCRAISRILTNRRLVTLFTNALWIIAVIRIPKKKNKRTYGIYLRLKCTSAILIMWGTISWLSSCKECYLWLDLIN